MEKRLKVVQYGWGKMRASMSLRYLYEHGAQIVAPSTWTPAVVGPGCAEARDFCGPWRKRPA